MAILRGALAAFDSTAFRADVWLDGSPGRALAGVAVSKGLPATEMVDGRRVIIETGDQPDPARFVVIAVIM